MKQFASVFIRACPTSRVGNQDETRDMIARLAVGAATDESKPKGTQMDKYKIIRRYFRGGRRTIETGLTLEQAQEHCSNPETSSRTATSSKAKARTRRMGPWFDSYEKE
jgi:hypothetical protein